MSTCQRISEFFPPKATLTEKDLPDLSGKVYMITGGASGIGLGLARMLYGKGAIVYIAARSTASVDKAREDIQTFPAQDITPNGKGEVRGIVFDLTDLSTIKPAVEGFLGEVERLDAVWFNAGIMNPGAGSDKREVTKQGYEIHWGTNVVGHFLLSQLLMPLLISTAKATEGTTRVIWVTSDGHNYAPQPDGINWEDINHENSKATGMNYYGQSKAGNIMLAYETAQKYGEQGVLSVSVHPGHLKTNLMRHSPTVLVKLIEPVLLYDPRFGSLAELFGGFSPEVNQSTNGSYIIPWGRIGEPNKHIKEGFTQRGTSRRLWGLLEKEVVPFAA